MFGGAVGGHPEEMRALEVSRGPYRIHAEVADGDGAPIVLLHGFPDSTHLYDRLVPRLVGRRPVVRFDFLGWGESDKPAGYPYTADNQGGDLAAVIAALDRDGVGERRLVLVAHDASGPPAIDWALAHPDRVAGLVLLNTYYQWTPSLRRPPAIALFSTPVVRSVARAIVRRRPDLDRRIYSWQVGRFMTDASARQEYVDRLYEQFPAAQPAFWRLNDDLLGAVWVRRRRVPEMRRFEPPVHVVFGARDRALNPRVAATFAALFPHSDLRLLPDAGHYVQVDAPDRVAEAVLAS